MNSNSENPVLLIVFALIVVSITPLFSIIPMEEESAQELEIGGEGDSIISKGNVQSIRGWFTENCGQIDDPDVRFVYATNDRCFAFMDRGYRITLIGENNRTNVVEVNFQDANSVVPVGKGELGHKSNHLIGKDQSKWRIGVKNYESVVYPELFKGIDLIFRTLDSGLKYEFKVSPDGDVRRISSSYFGVTDLFTDIDGNLHACTSAGEILEMAPYTYQRVDAREVEIPSKYVIEGSNLSFKVGDYDRTKDLIIDPIISSTFIGWEEGIALELDDDDNAYITGYSLWSDFPATPGSYDEVPNGNRDVIVCKLNSQGSELIYATYIGGDHIDMGKSIVVDSSNNAYITGYTYSTDFPVTDSSYDTDHTGDSEAFVCKLNEDGTDLVYSTFIGGDYIESGNGIALDLLNNAYITGWTASQDFPTTEGCFDETHNGGDEAFVCKLNLWGTDLSYSTFLGDGGGSDIEVDFWGYAYITGSTTYIPTTDGCYDNSSNGKLDVFYCRLNLFGSDLDFSTYVGGSEDDYPLGLELDSNNEAYITGRTLSTDFPNSTGCYDNSSNGNEDIFVLKLIDDASELGFSTYIGGSDVEWGTDLALDGQNNIYITGYTKSLDFPTVRGSMDESYNGNLSWGFWGDAFIIKLDDQGATLLYSSFIGSSSNDVGWAISLDSDENVFITGHTRSPDFPTTPGCYNNSTGGVFLLNMDFNLRPFANIISISPNPANESDTVRFRGNGTDDGTIQSYEWRSSLDGLLRIGEGSFDTSSLSNGSHMIFFRVMDNQGVWSEEVNDTIIVHGLPWARIDSIVPLLANESETVSFLGNGTDDSGIITAFEWFSDIDGLLSNEPSFTLTNLSNGTHTITLRVMNEKGVWGIEDYAILRINGIPVSKIESVTPDSPFFNEGEEIWFQGNASDDGIIMDHEWYSSIDGILAMEESFRIGNLSNGTHNIGYRVRDEEGLWSEDQMVAVSINGLPRARIMSLDEGAIDEGVEISFSGEGTDDGDVTGWEWRSNRDGLLSNTPVFAISNLTNGTHTITFKVRDSHDCWSEEVSISLLINGLPIAVIDWIEASTSDEEKGIEFSGYGMDDGDIIRFAWRSSIDGEFYNGTSDRFFNSSLSPGNHTIYLKVEDNHGTWGRETSMNLMIRSEEDKEQHWSRWWVTIIITIIIIIIFMIAVGSRKGLLTDKVRETKPDEGWMLKKQLDESEEEPREGEIGSEIQSFESNEPLTGKCPDCGTEINFLPPIDRWYCHECKEFVNPPDD